MRGGSKLYSQRFIFFGVSQDPKGQAEKRKETWGILPQQCCKQKGKKKKTQMKKKGRKIRRGLCYKQEQKEPKLTKKKRR